jgi:hypothetical protein
MSKPDAPTPRTPPAWQPLTPHGVASFAFATGRRTAFVLLLISVVVAATVIVFFEENCSPVIAESIKRMPDSAMIQNGHLEGVEPGPLSGLSFLSFVVDPEESRPAGQISDLQIELGHDEWRCVSLLGYIEFPYPPDLTLALGRKTAEPWWGAWKPMILAALGLGTFVAMWVAWSVLAVLLILPLKIYAFFADRELPWIGAWRLAAIAQMPGALLATAAIFLYGNQLLDLIRFGIFYGLHLLLSLIYWTFAPLCLPRVVPKAPKKKNPFNSDPGEKSTTSEQPAG